MLLVLIFSLNSCGAPVCPTASLQSPNLNSPPDFSAVGSLLPELSWSYPDPGCHPQGYRIDLSLDRDFADTSLSGGTGNPSTSWFPGSNLQPGKEYFWKVAPINDVTLGPASNYRRFFTGPYCDPSALAAPALIWPADGETIDTTMPGLHWANGNSGCLPQGYGIHLSQDPSFADTSLNGGTGNPGQYWYPGEELDDCTTYYWHVFSGIDTTFGPESATRSFRTDASGTCPPAGTGSISGLVFHDVCALPYESVSEPPPGCIDRGPIDGYGANGAYDPGEPGIPGVRVNLLQGSCFSSTILATAVTGPDGSYAFDDLAPGDYCVFSDSMDADNAPVLIPGIWTYPEYNVNPITQAVSLGNGELLAGILFGWDHQFLPPPPAPTQTLAPTLTPTLLPQPFFQPLINPKHIYSRGAGCGAMKAEIQVKVADSKQTAGVWFFTRLRNMDGDGVTGWADAQVMKAAGVGWYSHLLYAESLPDFEKYENAWVQYQFVAYDGNFNRIATSEVYSDLELTACHK
ncbi:MAG: hypothetical protein JW748_08860 [Anaerolineales bacterium]|nr:hypothetical protein [Anaerolineales bacterium]